jgi:hypothetical protein
MSLNQGVECRRGYLIFSYYTYRKILFQSGGRICLDEGVPAVFELKDGRSHCVGAPCIRLSATLPKQGAEAPPLHLVRALPSGTTSVVERSAPTRISEEWRAIALHFSMFQNIVLL